MSRPPTSSKGLRNRLFLGALLFLAAFYPLLLSALTLSTAVFPRDLTLWAPWEDPAIRYAACLSVGTSVLAGILSVVMAVPCGYVLSRYRFPGWPIHPVGFTIARGVAIDGAFFTIFLAWLVKAILLRLGGIGLYRQTQPFFLGMLVGFSAGLTLNFLVDMIWFPGQGHHIHGW